MSRELSDGINVRRHPPKTPVEAPSAPVPPSPPLPSAGFAAPAPLPEAHSLADIRAWAKENGHEVSDRGRLPNAVMQAYNEAHQG